MFSAFRHWFKTTLKLELEESEAILRSEAPAMENVTVTGHNFYQPLKEGGTELHLAIKYREQSKVEDILEVYVEDFVKVKNYLVSKYQWSAEDKIWLRKFVHVAADPDQCELVKDLERHSIANEDLQQVIFILLLNPIDGESVAVIHPNKSNQLELFRVLSSLIPNGFLSWNYTGLDGKQATFVETAASCGKKDIITRLLELGAELSLPGHNPLLAACQNLREDTIRWLLNKHFDDFDCTMRDQSQMNPFIVLLEKNNVELLDFVLKKMISYRQKYFGETELEAFGDILRYENVDWPNHSSLVYIRTGTIRDKVTECVAHYKLDLSYQWEGVTFLTELLQHKIAVEYCYAEIRKNPKLLKIIIYGIVSVLHECIRLGHLDILKEMYESNPELKRTFETDHALPQLQMALGDVQHDAARFILDHHKDFLMEDFDKLKTNVILCSWHEATFFVNNAELLLEYFPELKQELEEAKQRVPEYYMRYDLQHAFKTQNITFEESTVESNDPRQPLSTIRGFNGVTLLHYAVDKSDKELFTKLLKTGCDFDTLDDEGNHPVHYIKCAQMLDFLIQNHPEGQSIVNRKNSAGLTVLHKAFGLYDGPLIERIIEYGANVNQLTNDGDSTVHKTTSMDIVNILLKHNVNLEVVNKTGDTAFQHHLTWRISSIAGALFPLVHKLPSFKKHAHKCLRPFLYTNPDFFSWDYQPFLDENPDTTKLIFDSVYNHSREEASQLFQEACRRAHSFVVSKFLEFDYDLDYNCQDENGYTAIVRLLTYMEEDNSRVVKWLLRKGVDLEIRNDWGRTALLSFVERFDLAKRSGQSEETVQLLLDHGAQINATDNDGNNALHLAFANNEYNVVELLVQNGADLTVKNKTGKIPVEMGSCLNKEIFYFMA